MPPLLFLFLWNGQQRIHILLNGIVFLDFGSCGFVFSKEPFLFCVEIGKVNAQKFETAFYARPDLRNVRPPEEPAKSEPATLDLESLVEQLQKSPELASALAALIAAQAPAK